MPPLGGGPTRMRFSIDVPDLDDSDLLSQLTDAIRKCREVSIDWESLVKPEDPEGSGARLTEMLSTAHPQTVQAVCKYLCRADTIPIVRHVSPDAVPEIREELLVQVFTQIREAPEADVPALADSLVAMIKGEVVHVAAVVAPIEALLKEPNGCRPAVFVLGKLCEQFASNPTFSKAISPLQPALQAAIGTDSAFDYDNAFISRVLGWKLPGPQLVHIRRFEAVSSSSTPSMTAANSTSKNVVSSAYFGPSDELVTGGADGRICVWGAPGYGTTPSARFSLPPSFVPVSMDTMTKGRVLMVACVGPAPATPQIQFFQCSDAGKEGANWSLIHTIERDSSIISCIKRIHNKSNAFVVAEEEDAGVYGLIFFNSQGAVTRQIHKAHDTTITAVGVSPNHSWLVSGSKDGVVKIWDAKGTTITPLHILAGHTSPITAVIVTSDHIVTASIDGKLCQWDIKRMKKPVVEKVFPDPIIKAVLTGSMRPCVAVATLRCITLLTINGLIVEDVHPNVCASELRSNHNGSLLFGCGAHIDMYLTDPSK